ncbi:MAG: flavodoxin family protein [Planctomycetales bacterium]|nr:flavodoxin family protein [Planctomycetales bacterium]
MASGKTLIICFSAHHGNTRRIAEAIAEVSDATVVTPEEVQPEQLQDYDLVGWGSGIYFGRHADSLSRLARSLPQQPRKAFLFSTAGLPFLRWWFHSSLKATLKSRGCEIIGEFSCRGWDTVGPLAWIGGIDRNHPNERDLQRARSFAKSLVNRSKSP